MNSIQFVAGCLIVHYRTDSINQVDYIICRRLVICCFSSSQRAVVSHQILHLLDLQCIISITSSIDFRLASICMGYIADGIDKALRVICRRTIDIRRGTNLPCIITHFDSTDSGIATGTLTYTMSSTASFSSF